MEGFLYSWDKALFLSVNQGWSCPFLDGFFSFITDYRHFDPVFLALFLFLVWKGGPSGRWFVLAMVLAVLLADQSSSHLLKGWVERTRPCNALEGVLTPLGKSHSFSFPSSHAANMGASMLLLSLRYPKWTLAFLSIALLVGLSRVYLGLHYPSDVLGGYLVGMALALLAKEAVDRSRWALEKRKRGPGVAGGERPHD